MTLTAGSAARALTLLTLGVGIIEVVRRLPWVAAWLFASASAPSRRSGATSATDPADLRRMDDDGGPVRARAAGHSA